MSIAAAGAGAAEGLKQVLARRFLEQQQAARVQQEQIENQLRAQQEARIGSSEQADQAYRTGQVARQDRMDTAGAARQAQQDDIAATGRRQTENDRGVMQMMGQGLQQIDGATKPNRNQIMGMLSEVGKPPVAEMLKDPEADRQMALADYEAKKKLDRQYDRPLAGPQPEYEWVTRNGQAMQIRKGSAQPGDEPYAKPTTSGGLGAANVQLRNARIATALNGVEDLKKLAPKRTPGPMGLLEGAADTAQSWAGLNPQTRQYNAKLQPVAMQMAVAVQGAANLSDSERKAMAGMLGNIATMDYESQMALLDSAVQTLSNSGDVENVNGTWKPTAKAVSAGTTARTNPGAALSGEGVTVGGSNMAHPPLQKFGATYIWDGTKYARQQGQ